MISKPMKNLMRIAFLPAIILLITLGAFGQANTGSITGVVADQNGAVVPNATVNVTNQGTNEKRTVQADAEGRYEVPSLPTGVYSVESTASGFKNSTVKDVRLAVGEKARIDVAMNVSGIDAVVTVSDQTRTDTETPTIGDTIASERIQNNPVNGRDFTGLLATVPGSVQSTNQFQTSINGIASTFGGSSVLVDGIDAGRVDLNGTSNVLGRVESRVNRVSMDSIQEVQVLEQSYSAQYGQALSAIINPITKSGTNSVHGSAFDYFRDQSLDANDFFNNRQGFPRSRFHLNQFGGNVSGPIVKDKLFFFANYEGVRQTRGQLFTALTPTASFRSTMEPNIAPVLSTIPLPTQPFFPSGSTTPDPNVGIFSIQKNGTLREDTGSIKIDWMQSENDQYSLRYNINDSETITPYGVGTDQTAGAKLRVQLFKLSNTHTFSPTTVNEFAFGINNNFTDVGAGPSTLPRFSFIFFDAAIASPGPAQFAQVRTGNVYQILDTLSFVRGNHTLKAGADIRLNSRAAESGVQETLTFFSLQNFHDNVPFVVSRAGNPRLDYSNENFSFFIQDDWKVMPRLSLNLGLRYDVSTVSRESRGLLQNFDLTTLKFTPPGQQLHDMDTNNFGPRIGFAWDIFGKQRTVLRGGYGIFYNRELPASFGSPQANTFPTQSVDLFTALFVCGIFPQFPVPPSDFDCAVPSAFHIEKKIDTASAQQWSLNIQHDFGFGTLQVGYIGNHVTHLLTDGVVSPRNINRADPVTQVRPIAGFGDIFIVGGYPSSYYHALQATFKRNLSKGLHFNFNYTWAHEIDDIVGFFKDYQDENNARAEYASGDTDIRHNFTFDASYDIPSWRTFWGSAPRWLADGWQISTISQFRTGFPVNVTRQGGIFGGFSFRPDIVPGVDPYNATKNGCSGYSVPDCQFNDAAFHDPGAGVFGNAGRNILRGPHFAQVDLSVFKNTRLSERASLQLRMDIFNLFNTPNFADPSGGLVNGDANSLVGAAFFGQSTSTVGNQLGGLLGSGGPRQIQLSARFNF